MNTQEYKFKIDSFTPETLPMERLAEYMSDLAKVLGEPEKVHFVRIDSGSVAVVHSIEQDAVPIVHERMRASQTNEGPSDAVAAYRRLNRRLLDDNATGVLSDDSDNKVLEFPGIMQAERFTYGPFYQDSSLDGIVIRVGGVNERVPVTLESSGNQHTSCLATRDIAKEMAQHIFGPEIRVHGKGRWFRDKTGTWVLDRFVIGRFDVLENESLSAVLGQLRGVPGGEWQNLPDPWREFYDQRGKFEE